MLIGTALLASAGVGPLSAAERSIAVAILVLPSADTAQLLPSSGELAAALASHLRSAGFRVVVAGSPSAVPVEELTAEANAAGVDVAIGVRTLDTSAPCGAILTPPGVSRPGLSKRAIHQAEPPAEVTQLITAARHESSARLARSLASAGQWCPPRGSQTDAYVLEALAAPTIVLLVPARNQEQLTERLPGVLRTWAAAERAQE